MPNNTKQVTEYRRRAAECIEIAERTSLQSDRDLMMRMAQKWLSLAEQAEQAPEME